MRPNRERESYCHYCGKYIGMVDYDFGCPVCEKDICDNKGCYDEHYKECTVPYIKWLSDKSDILSEEKIRGGL